MMFISRRFLFTVLGCSSSSIPAASLLAKQEKDGAAPTDPTQAQPANDQDQDTNPLNRQLSDKERYKAA